MTEATRQCCLASLEEPAVYLKREHLAMRNVCWQVASRTTHGDFSRTATVHPAVSATAPCHTRLRHLVMPARFRVAPRALLARGHAASSFRLQQLSLRLTRRVSHAASLRGIGPKRRAAINRVALPRTVNGQGSMPHARPEVISLSSLGVRQAVYRRWAHRAADDAPPDRG